MGRQAKPSRSTHSALPRPPRIVLPADFRQPRQRANVRAFLARFTFCMANTQFSKPWRWLSLPIGMPFEIVAADTFGPLKPTARGLTHIIVLIDHHTRWMELIALPEPTAELVAEATFEH